MLKTQVLAALINLINRIWDAVNHHGEVEQQKEKEQRREDIKTNPTDAFSNAFGSASNINDSLRSNRTSTDGKAMRPNLPTTSVDKNGKRPSVDAASESK